METIIHVARHGQTEDNVKRELNHPDDILTPLGESQATELGIKLLNAGHSYDVVLVSPLIRAQQSAQLILKSMGSTDYTTMHDLRERDFDAMAGVPYDEIPKMEDILVTEGATYFLSGGDSETFQELLERARKALAEIKEIYFGKRVLIVAHGDIGKMLYAAYYERDLEETLKLFKFRNADVVVLADGSSYNDVYLFRES